MKTLIKLVLPENVRFKIRTFQKGLVYKLRREIIKVPIYFNIPMKIIIGAAMTSQSGWYSTNEQWLDVSSSNDWRDVFHGKCILKNVLAEHVFEHLTEDELVSSLGLIYRHLMPGGRLRIAVPDGYNPNPDYIKHVGIAGAGADAADHKQLLNYDSIKNFLEHAGFAVELLEGYRAHNEFVLLPINPEHGYVIRSRGNLSNTIKDSSWNFIDANTSLVVDGVKRA